MIIYIVKVKCNLFLEISERNKLDPVTFKLLAEEKGFSNKRKLELKPKCQGHFTKK